LFPGLERKHLPGAEVVKCQLPSNPKVTEMDDKILYLAALTMIFLMPGPDMILLLQTGARQGRGTALATAIGLAIARACHVTLAAVGLAALFRIFPWTFEVIKLAGAAYLLWLGAKMLRQSVNDVKPQDSVAGGNWQKAIRRGMLTNLLNPKALLFCSVLLPQFINPARATVAEQFALLGIILVVMGMMFDAVYALAGSWIGRHLEQRTGAQRIQQRLFGSLLIGFAVRLAWLQQV
jgi:threonine/homoserine/homoserine lactone efflux protein